MVTIAYQVRETDDYGALKRMRILRFLDIFDSVNANPPSYIGTQEGPPADLWIRTLSDVSSKPAFRGNSMFPDDDNYLYSAYTPNSGWVQAAGIGAPTDAANLEIGTRFWFSGTNYIRIANVQVLSTKVVVTYTYHINGSQVFSYDDELNRYEASFMYIVPMVARVCYTGLGTWTNAILCTGNRYVRHAVSKGVHYYTIGNFESAFNPSGFSAMWNNFISEVEPFDTENPYAPGGYSDETDLDPGNFSEDSDDVEEDGMPSLSAVGTGMATIFSPTNGQLKSLSDVFWGANWWQALQNTIEGIDKMFISLGIVPFSVTKGSTVEVTWLGLPITEVQLTLAAQQFYEFDMGTINLSNDTRIFTSGSALDYSPFSRLGIYLPFIGFQDLDIDECRGTTINVKYRIDILSGTCIALIKIGGNTIYQFTGNCVTQIPITSQNFENLFTNAVNVGIAFGVSRNAAAVASAGEAATAEMVQTGKMSATAAALDATQRSARVSGANASLGNATANAMMGMKPDFNKTGSVSASASLLAVKQPFLYLKTPRQCLPEHYQRYCGFPSNITGKLSEFSGYTVVEDIRLNGLVATSGEVEEIYDLLKSGVIV